jgi:uncharacterized protein
MDTITLAPISRRDRIDNLDVLRGVAVLGILLMNIPGMGMPWEYGRPLTPVGPTLDWIVYTIQDVVFAGSMRGLFTLLFGAGMVVMLRRADEIQGAAAIQAYLTRCFALLLLGVANFALFLWPGEILFNYGLCGLMLLLFRKAENRVMLVAAAAMLVFMSVALGTPPLERAQTLRTAQAAIAAKAEGKKLTKEQTEAITKREEMIKKSKVSPEERAKEREIRTHFPSVLGWSAKAWLEFNYEPISLLFLLESLSFMLIGVVLFRTGVLTGEKSTGFYATLAVGGYAAGLLVRGAMSAVAWRAGFTPNPVSAEWRGFVYELGRLPTTIGLLGLVTLLFQQGLLGPWATALKAVGRMALTNYVGQSVITSILFYGLGFYDRFGFAQLMGVAVLIWIVQAIFSLLWLRAYEMGPLEWLLRSLTYGTWKPLGPAAVGAPVAAE